MATDAAGHNLVDLVGNTLIVSDIQIASSTGVGGAGVTGTSLSSSNFSTESLSGQQKVMTGSTTATAASATAAILIGSDAIGIYWGNSTPSGQLSAITSSLYLNKAGTTVSTRAYINTGGTTWTAITTLA